jgi:hypothetical protein
MKKQLVKVILMAGLGAFVVPNTAKAALKLTMTSGVNNVTITDNGVGDANPAPGWIDLPIGGINIGDFHVPFLELSSSSPANPATGLGKLTIDTHNIRNSAAGARTLDMLISDNGFGGPGTVSLLSSSMTTLYTSATTGDLVTMQSTYDPTNVAPSSNPAFAILPQGAPATGLLTLQSFHSDSTLALPSSSGPYSLTEHVIVSLSANAEAQITGSTASAAVVPEPACLSLLGLVGLGLIRRRR